VYRHCGGKAVLIFLALLGSYRVNLTDRPFRLLNSFLEATGLNKTDVSRAVSKLEQHGYVEVLRQAGHKNRFALTSRGQFASVSPKK
jgi:DNA-binding MarR family transcriptional regulator